MECLVLDHLPLIAQQLHVQFEMFTAGDVPRHELVVAAVEEEFSEEFDALPFGDV